MRDKARSSQYIYSRIITSVMKAKQYYHVLWILSAPGGCKINACIWWVQSYSLHLVGARLQMNPHFGASFFLCDTTPFDPTGTRSFVNGRWDSSHMCLGSSGILQSALVRWDNGKTFTGWIKAWNFQGIFIRGLKKDSGGGDIMIHCT